MQDVHVQYVGGVADVGFKCLCIALFVFCSGCTAHGHTSKHWRYTKTKAGH